MGIFMKEKGDSIFGTQMSLAVAAVTKMMAEKSGRPKKLQRKKVNSMYSSNNQLS